MTCHDALPLPPLSTEVGTSMEQVHMVADPWDSQTIHECRVSFAVCLPNSLYFQTEHTLKSRASGSSYFCITLYRYGQPLFILRKFGVL